MLFLQIIWTLLQVIIFTAISFLINPILGILSIMWFIGLGIYAWKRHK